MIILYDGGGATVTEIYGASLEEDAWGSLKDSVHRLLVARSEASAADLLSRFPFSLRNGTNYFGDEFSVLHACAPLEVYTDLAELKEDPEARKDFQTIAETISEVGPYTRFVSVALDTENGAAEPVPPPSPEITSTAVDEALADAEQLISSRGPLSAVDRVHTAFHGYLRAVAARSGLTVGDDASITRLFKHLREEHPTIQDFGHRGEDAFRMLMGMATVLDSLNTIRNQASRAHPTESTLEESEAMLAINAARSLLHYLDEKIVYD